MVWAMFRRAQEIVVIVVPGWLHYELHCITKKSAELHALCPRVPRPRRPKPSWLQDVRALGAVFFNNRAPKSSNFLR